VVALLILLFPRTRRRERTLVIACLAVVVSLWIDKGLGMVVTGFVPSPLGRVTEYLPTARRLRAFASWMAPWTPSSSWTAGCGSRS